MALSGPHLDELVRELTELVAGRRIREVAALPPRDLLLVLAPHASSPDEEHGPLRRLLVSASADGPRIHLQIGPRRAHKGPVGPFFRNATEALAGRELARIERLSGERILLLHTGPAPGPTLVAELTGRHANLVLLDGNGNVASVLVPPKEDSAHAERLAVGGAWHAPRGGRAPRTGERPLAEVLPAAPLPGTEAEDGEEVRGSRALAELAPLSWRVEAALGVAADAAREAQLVADLSRRLKRRLTQARARLAGLKKEEENAGRADEVQRDGELLLAQHAAVPRGRDSIEVVDSYEPDAPRRRIVLDPKLTVRQNAERLFARAKKRRRAQDRLPDEIAIQEGFVAGVESLAERLRAGEPPDEVEADAVAAGWLPARQADDERRRPKRTEPRLPYRSFRGTSGAEIRVGRSARDNDALSFKHARGNDLWLHTADAPGSHVVLRLERGREPDPEDVLDAATLAIHFSPLRGAAKADVHVARCKELRKPKGAPAGLVTLSGGRNRSVRVEPERLERLLDRRRRGDAPGS